ncbi:nucleoside 2-deoxyribosyltransferase domain-containing protein [Kitasatospora sp. NPDC085464]|uniref:nucleoside 2-deoxyribosyltransferase domain-containing protein n=1 Tax=Kitasatospora sp. NPDC085464 TaxID=3364063 RepID=UPI0037C5A277
MEYFEAPAEYHPGGRPAVFLAGGITGCPDWQATAARMFGDDEVAVLNPRRSSATSPIPVADQIAWEYRHLHRAAVVLFWFPRSVDSVQPIALYELGMHAGRGTPIAVGVDRNYLRRRDVEIQLSLARPELTIHHTLSDSVGAARALLVQGDAGGAAG